MPPRGPTPTPRRTTGAARPSAGAVEMVLNWSRFAPPTCRTPLGAVSCHPANWSRRQCPPSILTSPM